MVSRNSLKVDRQPLPHGGEQTFHGLKAWRDLAALYPTHSCLVGPRAESQALLADPVTFAGPLDEGTDIHASYYA